MSLERYLWNSGLLDTLMGTMCRVVSDSMINLSALVDQNIYTDFVDATFFLFIPPTAFGYILITCIYHKRS